jgi:hypothetical protein
MRPILVRHLPCLTLAFAALSVALPAFANVNPVKDNAAAHAPCAPAVADEKAAARVTGGMAPELNQLPLEPQCVACIPVFGATPVATLIQLHESTRLPATVLGAQTCPPQDTAGSNPQFPVQDSGT